MKYSACLLLCASANAIAIDIVHVDKPTIAPDAIDARNLVAPGAVPVTATTTGNGVIQSGAITATATANIPEKAVVVSNSAPLVSAPMNVTTAPKTFDVEAPINITPQPKMVDIENNRFTLIDRDAAHELAEALKAVAAPMNNFSASAEAGAAKIELYLKIGLVISFSLFVIVTGIWFLRERFHHNDKAAIREGGNVFGASGHKEAGK